LLCDAHVWERQIAAFSDRYDVRVPDFRFLDTLDAMADAVLRDAPERFALAGHSMGGRV
jgi:pimeloyl-ACP methyl ester carboxylesterase